MLITYTGTIGRGSTFLRLSCQAGMVIEVEQLASPRDLWTRWSHRRVETWLRTPFQSPDAILTAPLRNCRQTSLYSDACCAPDPEECEEWVPVGPQGREEDRDRVGLFCELLVTTPI